MAERDVQHTDCNAVSELHWRTDMNERQIEFSVFCIENIALKLGITGEAVYRLLTKDNDILDEYIIPNYEILHTQSKEYIVNDIVEYMKECGVLK